jgi:hypothetical protein
LIRNLLNSLVSCRFGFLLAAKLNILLLFHFLPVILGHLKGLRAIPAVFFSIIVSQGNGHGLWARARVNVVRRAADAET